MNRFYISVASNDKQVVFDLTGFVVNLFWPDLILFKLMANSFSLHSNEFQFTI